MADTSQKRALSNYRKRLAGRGMARFEVLGLETDRELLRSLARRLAANDRNATRIRAAVVETVRDDVGANKGGILAALRRSPLVGAGLHAARPRTHGRKVEL